MTPSINNNATKIRNVSCSMSEEKVKENTSSWKMSFILEDGSNIIEL